MASSNDEDSTTRSTKGWPKKKPYLQNYRVDWQKNTNYSKWLRSSKKGARYFHCMFCNDSYLGGLSAVAKHSKTGKHVCNAKSVANTIPINQMQQVSNNITTDKKVKEAEIKVAMFITEHNIAFLTSDHLISLIKSLSPESNVINKMSCNRTKATAIVTNVIGCTGFDSLILKICNQQFSILIDESTDKSSTKHLAIVVRLMDYDEYKVRDEFLSLVEVKNCTAQGIYELIVNFFLKYSVPYKKNLIAFASDGANTMFGQHHSVKTLLENDISNLFVMKCICHSLALCASYACQKIPDEIEDTIRNIYTYMKYSFKRQLEFKEFQTFLEIKPHKLLQPSQTRWLALHDCNTRILEQLKALKLYFQAEHLIDNKASDLYLRVSNPTFELYLNFLDFILPILTSLNKLFQHEKPQIYHLYSKMASAYKTILDCYMQSNYLEKTDLEKVQYRNPQYFLKNDEIYVGGSRIVRKYPVLVFIHGESYEWNSGNPYDGRVLASNAELVVVTLNYRLGILGFLNANGSPNSRARVANYGLMDQIAVLHWVQQNIALFGGDPENVSLMGHGPGAACINFLMISPTVVPGLFRRAILLSGSALSSWALVEDPVSYALDLAKQVNCTTDGTGNNPEPIVDCLREVPLDLLMSAGVALPTYLSAFGPSVDGVVVKSNYQEDVITNLLPEFDGYSGSSVAFGARKFQKFEFGSGINKYDLLFGVVTSEALWRFSSNDIQAGFEGERRDKILRTYVRNAYSYHLSEIFFTIVNEYTDWERTVLHPINTRDATIAALSDAQYVAPLVHTGDMLSQPKTTATDDPNKDRRTKSFFYVFDYQTRDGDYPQRIGTAHGEELPYMFGAPMVTDGMNHFSRNFTKQEALLSDAMILYLGNFARTGDPNDHDDKPDSGSKERNRFRSVTWDEYDPVHQKYLEISMKPRMKNHFRAHQLSVWLRLIPELHRAGMEDVMLRHNLFRNHDDAELYEGVVRPDPLSRRAPQPATVNRFTANGTVAEVVQSLTTTVRPQWPAAAETTTCLPPARGGPNAANASTSAEDALATLGAAGYAAYSTALHVTIALGVSLLVLNGLLLVIICYQKDRFKCLQNDQQRQQTAGGQEDSVRYKAAAVPDDRQSAAVAVDKAGGGYDGRHHHGGGGGVQHHHHPPGQQQHLAADAVAVDMEQRHHHHHGTGGGHHQHHHMHHHHVPSPQTSATTAAQATAQQQQMVRNDMTFPKAAKPSSRLLHDHQMIGGCPPNGSLVHGTLPKPPPPPRSSVGVQSQESQPLLVQQGVGVGQMPKTGTLKMPVAAMSEMRV